MQIVEGKQPQSEDFARSEQVSDIGSGESGDVRVGGFADWAGVLGEDQVLDEDGAIEGKGGSVAGDPGRHDAIKHVDAAADHLENLGRRAQSHGIPGFVFGQKWHRIFDGAEHFFLGFADGDAADGIAVKIQFDEFPGRLLAEVGVDGSLNDAKVVLSARARFRFVFHDPIFAALGPAGGEAEGFRGVFLIAGVGRALVEEHRDVGSKGSLDFHAELGGEHHF